VIATGFSVTAEAGFRFQPPVLRTVAPGIHHAEAYDFGDMSFVETPDGLVVIDAGTFPENSALALAAVREVTQAPIQTLVLTHAHWDHIGGAATFVDLGAQVIVESRFDEELSQVSLANPPAFRWFFSDRPVPLDVAADTIVSEPTTIATSRRIDVIPVQGGETEDALVVHVPDAGVVFVGDVFMPYLGAPFTEEGNPVALLETIDTILALEPQLLVHGHPPLTELWTVERLPVLRDALSELVDATFASIREGRTLDEALRDNVLPESLIDDPGAVLPYLTMRQGVVKRLYDANTGYWQSDRTGIEILADSDWARALDLLGGGESAYVNAVEALLDQGEAALPLRIVDIGLVNHPDSTALAGLRSRALQRLRLLHSNNDPFRFIVYSEEAGTEMQPLDPEAQP
ncbi:MAG: MBL fold metallo-hydrolase, partial [Myxococcota bacterium]